MCVCVCVYIYIYIYIYIQADPESADSVSAVYRDPEKIWKIKEIKGS